MLKTLQHGAAEAALALEKVEAAARSNDWRGAAKLAEEALAKGVEHPKLLHMRAIGHEALGLLAEAQTDLERAHGLDPEDAGIAMALGLLFRRRNQDAKAAPLFERLVERDPAPVLHFHLGMARMGLGDHPGARRSFEAVTALDPNAAEAFGKLAVLAAHRGDDAGARGLAQKALSLKPRNQDARRALLEAAVNARQFDEAEAVSRRWLSEPDIGGSTARMHALSLLGDALEGLGRYDEAFAAYGESNAIFRQSNEAVRQPLCSLLQSMKAGLEAAPQELWSRAPEHRAPSPVRVHVFLLGFMRSGTTLLEQALSRHGAVASLEEREGFAASAHLLVQPGGMAHLSRLTTEEAESYRASYWRAVRDAGVTPDGMIFVDKLPLNGAKLPLIHKLFPDAKIIFAVRDPRDVVFSCFQRRLRPSAYTYELADLQSGARLYDAYMVFVRTSRAKLPLAILQHRHEDLIKNFHARMEEVCTFIGMEFTPDMAEFDAGVAADQVMSQTARQLRGGLNARGVGRWRAYEQALRPALPILEPWIDAFGYPPSDAPIPI
jgi:tetratricopeptide (TPR) repeat protein